VQRRRVWSNADWEGAILDYWHHFADAPHGLAHNLQKHYKQLAGCKIVTNKNTAANHAPLTMKLSATWPMA